MKPGDVVFYNPSHPSFNWNKGLFVILEVKDNILNLCKIDPLDPSGLELYDDGRCMLSAISEKGPITLTKLSVDITKLTW